VDKIVRLLQEQDKFVIAGHVAPDGDTIGSCFALARALTKMGKKAVVMLEGYAEKYNIIPGREYLYDWKSPLEMDVFVAVDCADLERLGSFRGFFEKAKTTICIDHHETNKGFAEFNYIEPDASSTAEMVFDVIEALPETFLDQEIATCIYAGIIGDTGGFRYSSTSQRTMEIAAKLMSTGINFPDIYSEILHKHSFAASKAFGIALANCEAAMDGRVVYTHLTREMLASVGADSSDMDNVVEYLMSTRGAEAALFFYERHQSESGANANPTPEATSPSEQKKIKVSMRSKGLHIGHVAAHFGGGGHRMAAGCTIMGNIQDVMQDVLALIVRFVEGEV